MTWRFLLNFVLGVFIIFIVTTVRAAEENGAIPEAILQLSPDELATMLRDNLRTPSEEIATGKETCPSGKVKGIARMAIINADVRRVAIEFDDGVVVQSTDHGAGPVYTFSDPLDDVEGRLVEAPPSQPIGCYGPLQNRDALVPLLFDRFEHWGKAVDNDHLTLVATATPGTTVPYNSLLIAAQYWYGRLVVRAITVHGEGGLAEKTIFQSDFVVLKSGAVRATKIEIVAPVSAGGGKTTLSLEWLSHAVDATVRTAANP